MFLHLVLPVCSLLSLSCLLSPSRHCEARARPSAAGLATRSADGHSTSLPRLLCVSCGSGVRFWKHLHEGPGGGGGENNPRCCCGPKQQHYRPGNERGSLQKSTRGLSAGARCRPPGGTRDRRESGLGGCFISSSLGNVSRLTAQRPVGQGPLYRMRRPTARIAWTVQPMRPPQRDREARVSSASPRHDGVGSRPSCSRGPTLAQAVSSSPPHVSLFPFCPPPAAQHTSEAHEACHSVRGDGLGLCQARPRARCLLSSSCPTDSTGRAGHGPPSPRTSLGRHPGEQRHLRLTICQMSCHSRCTHAWWASFDVVTGSSSSSSGNGTATANKPPDASGCSGTQTVGSRGDIATSNLCCGTREREEKEA